MELLANACATTHWKTTSSCGKILADPVNDEEPEPDTQIVGDLQEWAEKNGIQSALECPVNPPDEEKPDA
jgi:hypothetical protein